MLQFKYILCAIDTFLTYFYHQNKNALKLSLNSFDGADDVKIQML